jgi:hypothetical protein
MPRPRQRMAGVPNPAPWRLAATALRARQRVATIAAARWREAFQERSARRGPRIGDGSPRCLARATTRAIICSASAVRQGARRYLLSVVLRIARGRVQRKRDTRQQSGRVRRAKHASDLATRERNRPTYQLCLGSCIARCYSSKDQEVAVAEATSCCSKAVVAAEQFAGGNPSPPSMWR